MSYSFLMKMLHQIGRFFDFVCIIKVKDGKLMSVDFDALKEGDLNEASENE